jgi:hypothetical protein
MKKARRSQEEGKASEQGRTPFVRGVHACIEYASHLPAGWRTVYLSCMSRLLAMDCAARSETVVPPPLVRGDGIGFLHVWADRAVLGLLRKTEARIAALCADCGRTGKSRIIGGKRMCLCPECYAPRALRLEAGLALKRLKLQETTRPVGEGLGLVATPRLSRALRFPTRTIASDGSRHESGTRMTPERLEILVHALGPIVHRRRTQGKRNGTGALS